jgi:hypothetical protein
MQLMQGADQKLGSAVNSRVANQLIPDKFHCTNLCVCMYKTTVFHFFQKLEGRCT